MEVISIPDCRRFQEQLYALRQLSDGGRSSPWLKFCECLCDFMSALYDRGEEFFLLKCASFIGVSGRFMLHEWEVFLPAGKHLPIEVCIHRTFILISYIACPS